MKINPIGIQSYRQMERHNNQAKVAPDVRILSQTDPQITISPKPVDTSSQLAVKAPKGDYTEFLTPEERNALDILFRRFSDLSRFGPAYQRETTAAGENGLVGQFIDVKV